MEDKKTSEVPETSTTLLRDVADAQHARWAVFHSRYEPILSRIVLNRGESFDHQTGVAYRNIGAYLRGLMNGVPNI